MPAMLLIKTNPNAGVASAPARWERGEIVAVVEADHVLGARELLTENFYRFTVTDRTVEEMQQYLQPWNRVIDMQVVAGPDPQGFRRINVRNNLVNASGTRGQWTAENTDAIIAEWNERYPTTNLTTVQIFQGTNPGDTWQCEGTFTQGQADEFQEVVIEAGLADLVWRRIWYITEAGMQNIGNAGGVQSGTSAQLNNVLRDGMLD